MVKYLIALFFSLAALSEINAFYGTNLPINLPLQTPNIENDDFTNKYNTIVQDYNGFIWASTDQGISRYDGHKVKRYNLSNSKDNNIDVVSVLFIGNNNILWASSGSRLYRYTPTIDKFEIQDIKINDKKNTIRYIGEDKSGTLWLAGDNIGLIEYSQKHETTKNTYLTNRKHSSSSHGFLNNKTQTLWLSNQNSLIEFDTQEKRIKNTYPEISNRNGVGHVVDLIQDSHGYLWLATDNGLYKFSPKTRKTIKYSIDNNRKNGLKSRMVWSLLEDSKNRIWIGTDKKGLHLYQPKSDDFLHYPSSETDLRFLPVAAVSDIFEDRSGTIWLSLGTFGIRKFNLSLNKFESIYAIETNPNSLSSNNVLDLHETDDGHIWVATDGAGLNLYNPQTNTAKQFRYDPSNPNSISSDAVISIDEDQHGNLWIGTWAGGLNYFDKRTEKFTRYHSNPTLTKDKTLGSNHVFDVSVIDTDHIMISCWGYGVQILNITTKTFTNYSPKSKKSSIGNLQGYDIRSITYDKYSNAFWASGYQGLEKFTLTPFSSQVINIPNIGTVTEVFIENTESLWIASQNGLFNYNPITSQHHRYIISEYSPSNSIMSIEPGGNDDLWLGTRGGLVRFNKNSHHIEIFDNGDGLTGTSFNYFAHLKSRDGLLYFGNRDGLNRFHPNTIPINTNKPNVYITNIEVNDKSIVENTESIQPAIIKKHITLPYLKNNITFESSSLSYIYPKKNRYRYKLIGFDDHWKEVSSSRRRASYTNLSPGKYTYIVYGSNNDNIWSQEPDKINITILPPWWKTWWATTLFIISSSTFIFSVFLAKTKHTQKRTKQLNNLINERTLELKNSNRKIKTLNKSLETRVKKRTEQLSKEVEHRKKAQKQLHYLAYHDTLTTLPNRSWMMEKLDQIIKTSPRKNIGILFLDGNKFKNINDTYGHTVGDELLSISATRIQNLLTENEVCIRLGGDEFVVLKEDTLNIEQLINIANSIINEFSNPFTIKHHTFEFQVSIGIALCDESYTQVEACLRDADEAMYKAKTLGAGAYTVFKK